MMKRKINLKRNKTFLYGGILFIISIIIIAFSIFIHLSNFTICDMIYIILIMLIVIFFASGLIIIRIGFVIKPIKIHKNGIFFPEIMSKDGFFFIPYGRIKLYSEQKVPVWGEIVQFHLEGNRKYFITKSTPGFIEIFKSIKSISCPCLFLQNLISKLGFK